MFLQPLLRFYDRFIVVGAVRFILIGGGAECLANFGLKLVFDGPGDAAAKPLLHNVYHQVGY